jgi:exosortase
VLFAWHRDCPGSTLIACACPISPSSVVQRARSHEFFLMGTAQFTSALAPYKARLADRSSILPLAVTLAAFAVLFFDPFTSLVRDWWKLPEAGHGLLLAPVSVWLAWRRGRAADAAPDRVVGLSVIVFGVLLRYSAGLAAEVFTMRLSIMVTLAGLTIHNAGMRQLRHWWLPFLLLTLSVPLPELLTQAAALPLQFKASQMGAALLKMRHVPVLLSGNVIRLPGRELFVTEACSGLRSLTALISTTLLISAMTLVTPLARVAVIAAAIPIAIVVNGIRVFLTGFLVFFVSPAMGQGFMHVTEGWLLFIVSLAVVGALAASGRLLEAWYLRRSARV